MYSIGIPLIDLITFGTLEYYVKPPTPKRKTKKKPHKQKMTKNRVIKSRQKNNKIRRIANKKEKLKEMRKYP